LNNIGAVPMVQLKREAGENPARSRRCNGEAVQKLHWGASPLGRIGELMNQSQKTCHIVHRNSTVD